jgi:hypothetical protein
MELGMTWVGWLPRPPEVFSVQKDTLFCRLEANSGSQMAALDKARQGHQMGK